MIKIKPYLRPKRISQEEILYILTGIENTRVDLENALDEIAKTEAHDRLNNLYVCLPVSDIIECVSEAGRKLKGVA